MPEGIDEQLRRYYQGKELSPESLLRLRSLEKGQPARPFGRVRQYLAVAAVTALAIVGGVAIVHYSAEIAQPDKTIADSGSEISLIAAELVIPCVNAGVSGDTTQDALARLEQDVFSHDPRVVVVLLGGNDFLARVPRSTTQGNLVTIVRRCQERGAMVVLVGIKLGLMGDAYGELYDTVAEENGAWYVKNIWRGVFGKREYMDDKIHPNAGGYRIMADRLGEELEQLLAAADRTLG